MQKREYRDWVGTVHQNTLTSNSGKSVENFADYTKTRRDTTTSIPERYQFVGQEKIKMEESFTIHLGRKPKIFACFQYLNISPLSEVLFIAFG